MTPGALTVVDLLMTLNDHVGTEVVVMVRLMEDDTPLASFGGTLRSDFDAAPDLGLDGSYAAEAADRDGQAVYHVGDNAEFVVQHDNVEAQRWSDGIFNGVRFGTASVQVVTVVGWKRGRRLTSSMDPWPPYPVRPLGGP